MPRNPIVRNAILQVLEKNGPLRFSELRERTKSYLGRKKLSDKPLAGALNFLIRNGLVEKKINEAGQIIYTLTKTYFEKQLQNILKQLLEGADNLDFYHNEIIDEENPPVFSFSSKGSLPTIPTDVFTEEWKRWESSHYNPYESYKVNWQSPIEVIVARMLDALNEFNEEGVYEGIKNFFAYAYWVGVQDTIAGLGLEPLPEEVKRLKNHATQIIEEAEKMGESNTRRVKVEKLLLQILDLTEELISKNNLKDFLDFLFKKTPVIKQLQTEMLKTYRLPGGGEKIWDTFTDYHNLVLLGLQRVGVKVENKYLLGCSAIWNKFIEHFLYSPFLYHEDIAEWESLKTPIEGSAKKLKAYANEYLKYLIELPEKSKMLITYVWGFPEILEVSEKSFLPYFERWYSALKEGSLDHRSWLFSYRVKSALTKAIVRVKRGLPPEPVKIDAPECWTLKDLYDFHPRGKDPSFWEELYHEFEKRGWRERPSKPQ